MVFIVVDDSGTFLPISEVENNKMTEVLAMYTSDTSYNYLVCGYIEENGLKKAVITKYDALRNAYVDTANTTENMSVCKGISVTIPFSNSWLSFFIEPTQYNFLFEYQHVENGTMDIKIMTMTNEQEAAGNVSMHTIQMENEKLILTNDSFHSKDK